MPRLRTVASQGQVTKGIAQMRQGMDAQRAMGAELQLPYRLAILAEVYGQIGQTAEALRLLSEALALAHRHGWHFYEAEV